MYQVGVIIIILIVSDMLTDSPISRLGIALDATEALVVSGIPVVG
jgi:hypothetical protein